MPTHTTRDLVVGLFVLVGISAVAWLSLSVGGIGYSGETISLHAAFDQVAGLKARAPVEVSGVRVGQVTGISLDETTYRARVHLEVDSKLDLPIDTSASIVTSGLLGDRYLALDLGAEEDTLQAGDEIAYTESAMVLERLIGKFLYNVKEE